MTCMMLLSCRLLPVSPLWLCSASECHILFTNLHIPFREALCRGVVHVKCVNPVFCSLLYQDLLLSFHLIVLFLTADLRGLCCLFPRWESPASIINVLKSGIDGSIECCQDQNMFPITLSSSILPHG